MILIVESNSTRTEWSLIDGEVLVEHLFTSSLNPISQIRRDISRIIRLELPKSMFNKKIDIVYYYGAGCEEDEKRSVLSISLTTRFRTYVRIEPQVLGAARAFLQNKIGIMCLLDAESGSCLYNGKDMEFSIKSGGYILGDEGSGASIGKAFIGDMIKNLVPEEIGHDFLTKNLITQYDMMDIVYEQPFPGKFFDNVSQFLASYRSDDYVINLVSNCIEQFFSRSLLQYDYLHYPIYFAGKTAKTYQTILKQVAIQKQIKISIIEDNLMNGLIKFHSKGRF